MPRTGSTSAWRRLTAAARGSFPLEGSNWFARPQNSRRSRRGAQTSRCSSRRIARCARPSRISVRAISIAQPAQEQGDQAALVTGVAAHDLYHAGQIQLLKRLAPR